MAVLLFLHINTCVIGLGVKWSLHGSLNQPQMAEYERERERKREGGREGGRVKVAKTNYDVSSPSIIVCSGLSLIK